MPAAGVRTLRLAAKTEPHRRSPAKSQVRQRKELLDLYEKDETMIYSYFTNEYTLTEDMCAETETSRMDLGIACVFVAAAAILAANLWPSLELIPEIPGLLYEYFSSPSSRAPAPAAVPAGTTGSVFSSR